MMWAAWLIGLTSCSQPVLSSVSNLGMPQEEQQPPMGNVGRHLTYEFLPFDVEMVL